MIRRLLLPLGLLLAIVSGLFYDPRGLTAAATSGAILLAGRTNGLGSWFGGRAFKEWGRVLRPGGIIYAVIPDRRHTWDRNRSLSSVEHLLEDFANGVDQSDGTHIDDFVTNIVWDEFAPGQSEAEREIYRQSLKDAVRSKNEINIHFHTFECNPIQHLVAAINSARVLDFQLDLVDLEDRFPESCPNGFLAVMRVTHTGIAKYFAGMRHSLIAGNDTLKSVRKGTPRLARWDSITNE